MLIRNVSESDYKSIITVLNDWWGGRQMTDMLPKLFFTHFKDTSFVAENDGNIIGFIVGFISQSYPGESYIHFVGIHPQYRGTGIGRQLYFTFFENVRHKGCKSVRCVTSPLNKASIAYHTAMGFVMENSNIIQENNPIHIDYDGYGQDRVLFIKRFADTIEEVKK